MTSWPTSVGPEWVVGWIVSTQPQVHRRSGGAAKPEQREWPSFRGAINESMREAMRRDRLVFQMGEDIALAAPFGFTTYLRAETS